MNGRTIGTTGLAIVPLVLALVRCRTIILCWNRRAGCSRRHDGNAPRVCDAMIERAFCSTYGAHLRHAGFLIRLVEQRDLEPVKKRLGAPTDLASCHTAELGGYLIEGHVPAGAIRRLLAERPSAVGLAVPGMPAGSQGMEGGTPEIYEVILFGDQGRRVFARYLGSREH